MSTAELLEIVMAYQQLLDEFGVTHDIQAARRPRRGL